MTTLRLVALALLATPLAAQYTYYYADTLTSVNSSNWTQNGDFTTGSSGLVAPDDNGGSLISTLSSPTQPDYEVRATLNLTTSGGLYAIYLRASQNAYGWGNGSYYSFEGSPQEFVTSVILRGFPDLLKSDIFGVGHGHAPCFQ